MSQILDALKRSEAARAQTLEPTTMPAPVWRATPGRAWWPWVLAVGVMLVLGAGAWHNRSDLWPERYPPTVDERPADPGLSPTAIAQAVPETAVSEGATPTPVAPVPVESAPAQPAQVPVESAPAQPAPVESPPVVADNTPAPNELIQPDPMAPPSVAELAPTPTDPGTVPVPIVADQPSNPVGPLTTQTAGAAAITPVATDPNTVAPIPESNPAVPVTASPAPAAPPEPAVAEPAAVVHTDPAPAIMPTEPTLPTFMELPYSLRRDLPELRFSMYRYNEDPSQRFVVYKERRVGEQGVLGQELWLREIHADHLVLDFRGTLFTVTRH